MNQSTAEHDADQHAGNPFDDQQVVPRYIADSLADAMAPHEDIDDIPPGPVETKAQTNSRILHDLVSGSADHLCTAGQMVFEAIQRGAIASDLCEAFGVEPDFLETLHHLAMRRMLGFIVGDIQLRDHRIDEIRQEQRQLEELAANLESGDVAAFTQATERGY